jgi:hypothetical protein
VQVKIRYSANASFVAGEEAITKKQLQSSGTSSKSVSTTYTSNQIGTIAQKKGWSSAAKGAVIGGVIGTGTGYVISRKQDKKSSRINQ